MTFLRTAALTCLVASTALLAGCEIPGMGPDPKIAQREAEAKAVGGACRHALRGPEDCYALNPKSAKAAVFAGWKEMDAYMRENKLDGAASTIKPAQADPVVPAKAEAAEAKPAKRKDT